MVRRERLTLDDGKNLAVVIVAHAEGSPTAYFESVSAAHRDKARA